MKLIDWISSSLRAKLLTMFVILTVIPLIGIGLISYQKSYNTVYANSKAGAVLVADQLAQEMETVFTDTGKLLELGKHPRVLHFLFSQSDTYEDAKEILRTMDSYRQTYKYEGVLNITMINLYGRGISERRGVFQLDKNPLRNPHFAYLTNHPDAVLNVPPPDASPLDRLDGLPYEDRDVISIMAAVKQRITHEVIGFIVIDLDVSVVKQFCDNVSIGKTGFFYIVDQNGRVIFTPSQLERSVHFPEQSVLSGLAVGSLTGYVDSSKGVPKFIFASASPTTGWKIIGQVPLQEIVEEANSIRQLIIVSVVLSIAFAVTLHFFISSRLTRPLQLLKNKMKLAASGFLEAKVNPTGKDEIADLGKSFNIMLGKIKSLLERSIKEQEEIKKAELRALQAQINPHFLYNTLDSIVWMAEAGKNDKVIRLVESLSRLFRISLSKGLDWIPLEQEIEHVHSYLIIQQMRYRDILDYEIDVDPNIRSHSILKMTLQPIVENALYHGLKNKRGKGMIRVTARAAGGQFIELAVQDSGIGMTPEKLETLRTNLTNRHIPAETGEEVSGGFGLHNVHQRIRLYYGEHYGVRVESVELEGTTVTIRIPTKASDDG
ncbi:sensor histidine kinase [Paenibacillus sp. MSJ-34]|uniref:sensor histidine kinase n=1 Tax=Paenibacillus sp. MSJ-34 TaxID=2841529 RepID=UPI001C125897|nr:sensor histidine kinase [Paenibacillus sp. MSJ-34]MBU5441290.1 sensor histidine kinase [Paenibacillus sp. MSJ-34]